MSENANQERQVARQVPRSAEEYLARRQVKSTRTLNDEVESIHLALASDEQYQKFLDAVYDSDAVEGSLPMDDGQAAAMLRDKARAVGNIIVAGKNLTTLVKSLRVVLNRSGDGRDQRRFELHGRIVSPHNLRAARNDGSEASE